MLNSPNYFQRDLLLMGRKDYPSWCILMQAFLEMDNLWSTTICVESIADEEKDRIARSKLTQSIDRSCFVHIEGAKTAKEIWKKLADTFAETGLGQRVGLLRKFNQIHLKNCGSIEKYVNEVFTTAHKLNKAKFLVSDEWIGMKLLSGLTPEYNQMICTLESSGNVSGDYIKTKLLRERIHMKTRQFSSHNKRKKTPPKCRNLETKVKDDAVTYSKVDTDQCKETVIGLLYRAFLFFMKFCFEEKDEPYPRRNGRLF